MLEIGKKIKTIRQQRGWSQADVAEMLSISVPAFSKIETDHTDINISRLKQIADLLRVPIEELVSAGPLEIQLNNDELKRAKETIEAQSAKITHLQEYVITLYEKIHKGTTDAVSTT